MPNNLEDFKKFAESVISDFKHEISGIRTSRPTPLLVEDLKVNYYEQTLPLKQVASTSVVPPRSIYIQTWDKEAVPGVVKAIEASGLNVAANVDGNTVKLNFPELSSERREELIKHLKKIAEAHRIKLRHLRDEANKKVEAMLGEREINEDQKFKLREEVQKKVDEVNASIEGLLDSKTKEINE